MNAIVPFDPASQAHGSGVSAKIAFVYPGHGAQWPRMAAELLDSSPPFAARMSECADALAPFLGWSPVDVLRGSGEALEAGAPEVVQPVLFAVMVSLTALWEAHGVTPDAVIGHSIGEASAGYVAGALSLADAARVVASCSRAQARLAGRGEMASVMLSATAMRERLARWHGNVVVAVINGPAAVLISGDRDAVTEEVASLNAEGISARLMPLGVAAHSPGIDEVGEEVREPLAPIAPLTPSIPLYSSLNGGRVVVPMDAGYWFRMLREPVQFDPAVRVLLDDGYNVFIEVSPHPVLCGAIADTADDHAVQDVVVANTLRRGEGNLRYFYTQAAEIFARGKIAEEGLKEKLSLLSAAGQRRALLRLIRDQAAIIIRSPGALDEQRTFFELGFDSAAAVELRNRLRRVTGLSLPSSLVFNYPTPARLAERLYEEFAGPVDHAVNAVADGGDPIAIVGMACRFAGGTDSPELLWRLVDDGRDVISGLPADRGWDLAGLYDPDPERAGRTYVRAGGFLRDAGDFDAEFFGISPREALAMDPQQRVLLECA